jgi:hypothetical protein
VITKVNGIEVEFLGDPVEVGILCVDMLLTLHTSQDTTGTNGGVPVTETHENLAPVPRQNDHNLPVPRPLPVLPRLPARSGHVSVPSSD